MLKYKAKLREQIVIASASMFNTMLRFFIRSFTEVQSSGLRLQQLKAIERALGDNHLNRLQQEIDKF